MTSDKKEAVRRGDQPSRKASAWQASTKRLSERHRSLSDTTARHCSDCVPIIQDMFLSRNDGPPATPRRFENAPETGARNSRARAIDQLSVSGLRPDGGCSERRSNSTSPRTRHPSAAFPNAGDGRGLTKNRARRFYCVTMSSKSV